MEEEKDDEQKQNGFMSRLLKTRTILVNGEVDQELAEKVISQLLVLDSESHDPIRMIITSNGGHIDSGYASYAVV
ncbi:MAG: ATP-dependent Clp protease proteolytic subunit [Bacteroidetes bacterium]|nr:ATP-dependent Clp protease proteolytic subunit [Bacteroidota bacterium]